MIEYELHLGAGAQALDDGSLLHERWRIIGTSDIGDTCILYDAMDILNGKVVSIREYCPQAHCKRFGTALVPGKEYHENLFQNGLEEFERTTAVLQEVPHIQPVIEYFRENDTCYAVFGKSDGKRLLDARPLLTETYAQSLGLMLCDTFAALHRNHLYYGTIHEEDLRFTEDGALRAATDHISAEGSVANDLRGLTALLHSMLPIERSENPTAAMLDKALRCSYRDTNALKAGLLGKKVTRKPSHTSTLRGVAGLALCVLCLSGAIFLVKHLASQKQPLTRALKSGKIEPEVISVWAPLPEEADETQTIAMYKKLAKGFERKHPGCGVDIRLYADGSFEDALTLVKNGAQSPAVFMDTQDEVVLEQAADLTPLTSVMKDVYITDMSGFGNSLPLACSIPVLYYNTYSLSALSDYEAQSIDFASLPTGTLFDDSASIFLQSLDAAQKPDDCFEKFLTDAGAPVLASSSCMAQAEHSGMTSGAVQMMPVSVDGAFPVQYEMYCSVSDQVEENTKQVGMLWLQYLLTEEAQQILFVENYGDLPLHRSAFKSAVSVHSGMTSLKGIELDSMMLQVRR